MLTQSRLLILSRLVLSTLFAKKKKKKGKKSQSLVGKKNFRVEQVVEN